MRVMYCVKKIDTCRHWTEAGGFKWMLYFFFDWRWAMRVKRDCNYAE